MMLPYLEATTMARRARVMTAADEQRMVGRLRDVDPLRAMLRECATYLQLTMDGDARQDTPERRVLVGDIRELLAKPEAKRVDAVVVNRVQTAPGVTYLVVKMDGTDYADYKRLPKVVEYDGRLFGATGWNSDKGEAYFADNVEIAKAHRGR